MTFTMFITVLSTIFTLAGATCPTPINLDHARHLPSFTNSTTHGHSVTIYKNIRFGYAPRFRHADTSLPPSSAILNGLEEPYLAQACISTAPDYIPYPDVIGTWGREDCLFLDVYVPEGVQPGDDVPVFHWFYGSAYAFGSKEVLFNPLGLLDQALEKGEKFIFVANNYRMGVSGFTYSETNETDPNVGLYDCLAAAEWTKKYISRFGGDPGRITAGGQSAGAGMLYYMASMEQALPFQQVFLSSPAAPPRDNVTARQEELFSLVLDTANCTDITCVRSLPEEDLKRLNKHLIADVPGTSGGGVLGPVMGFGPAPDGTGIPDLPLRRFMNGQGQELRVLAGSMALEGRGTSHDSDQPEYFPTMVRQVMPNASDEVVDALLEEYWDASEPRRIAWDWTTDAIFSCNGYNLVEARADSRRYVMSAPPATHGQDSWYYFYVDEEMTPLGDASVARALQGQLLRFIAGEDMDWPVYGDEGTMLNITASGFEIAGFDRRRCALIKALVLDPGNGA